jgi:hypothetical protein
MKEMKEVPRADYPPELHRVQDLINQVVNLFSKVVCLVTGNSVLDENGKFRLSEGFSRNGVAGKIANHLGPLTVHRRAVLDEAKAWDPSRQIEVFRIQSLLREFLYPGELTLKEYAGLRYRSHPPVALLHGTPELELFVNESSIPVSPEVYELVEEINVHTSKLIDSLYKHNREVNDAAEATSASGIPLTDKRSTNNQPRGFEGLGEKKQDFSRYFDATELTDLQRMALSLNLEHGLSKREIGRRMGLHHATVDEHIKAGTKRLDNNREFLRRKNQQERNRTEDF